MIPTEKDTEIKVVISLFLYRLKVDQPSDLFRAVTVPIEAILGVDLLVEGDSLDFLTRIDIVLIVVSFVSIHIDTCLSLVVPIGFE